MDTTHKFVFICGLHRSGTSVLHHFLRTLPEISGFHNTGVPEDEGQHLQTVYPAARAFGGPGKFGFDPGAAMTETHALITDQNRTKLYQEWSRYWNPAKPILLEKSPPNIIRTRFLQALFPNSCFIVLTRHPIAVSYATQKWAKTPLSKLFRHWIAVHRIFEQDRPHLSRVCVLSYEELIHTPVASMQRIGALLGISIDQTYPFTDHNAQYFQKWYMPGTAQRISRRWNSYLFEREINHFGYSLRDTSRYPTFAQ